MANSAVFYFIPLFLILNLLCFSSHVVSDDNFLQYEWLKVSKSEFLSSLNTTIDEIKGAKSVFAGVNNFKGDSRLENAISDCVDLFDFSHEELSWIQSALQNPNGKHNGTGDIPSDLTAWLSAAMANVETCMDEFDGTNGIVVTERLRRINSMLRELLVTVKPSSGKNGVNNDKFPSWVKHEDRKWMEVNGLPVDVVVAADGSGNFTNITAAVAAVPDRSMKRFVIYIKKGVYKEYVEIKKKKWNIMMVGDGMNATVISGNRNHADGWKAYRGATFAVNGRGFIARNITFENTAGPAKEQAVALRSDSDLSVFYRCEIRGYQDALYTHSLRQFFKECTIRGTVDFIFGYAAVVFQKCQILVRRGLAGQQNTITAHGRTDPRHNTGFTIQFCNITADSDLIPFLNSTPTYLGRPWRPYSRTIVMQSNISNAIRPEGWLPWNKSVVYLDTLYYGEYMNYGPGSGLGRRVKWPGYHVLNKSAQVVNFTVAQLIKGNLWLPSTGLKYTEGLGE